MNEEWKDCDQPWTIDEFLEARETSALDEAHPAGWATVAPTIDGHYWFLDFLGFLDVLEVMDEVVYHGGRCMPENHAKLYGPRIAPPKAPR